jgi:hypothetical protein
LPFTLDHRHLLVDDGDGVFAPEQKNRRGCDAAGHLAGAIRTLDQHGL